MKVKNFWNVEIDFDEAVSLMDNEIREEIHKELIIRSNKECTEQDFFNAYCKAHEERYCEEWELAKENPCY